MKKIVLTLAALLVVAAVSSQAHAQATAFVSGNDCSGARLYPWGATDVNTIGNGTPVSVFCSIPVYSGTGATQISLLYYDRNPNANIHCDITAFDGVGSLLSQFALDSTGGGPGTGVNSASRQLVGGTRGMTAVCTLPLAFQSNGVIWQTHLLGFSLR